jgi:hypothetical protein
MRTGLLAIAIVLGVASSCVRAEELQLMRECYGFKTKTTELDRLKVPDLPPKDAPATIELKTVWSSAQDFRDEQGRSWYLFRGKAPTGAPEKLTGWLVKSELGREFFYTRDGQLFGREPFLPIVIPCPMKVTNLPPTK